jgi:large subunit ribosomal protein L7/L12
MPRVFQEKTEFDVVVVDVDAAKRIGLIKVVRALTPLGLKEAKDAVTTLPSVLLAGVSKDKAEDAKKQLEEGGAKVEIK